MPWQNGQFTRENPDYSGADIWQLDQKNNKKIEADRHDHHDQDLANGINNCLAKDGSNQMTANLNMGNFKITNVGKAATNDELMTYGQSIHNVSSSGSVLTFQRPDETNITFNIKQAAVASVAEEFGSPSFLPTNFNGVKTASFTIAPNEGWLVIASTALDVGLPATLVVNQIYILRNSKASLANVTIKNPKFKIVGSKKTLDKEDLILEPGDLVYLVATSTDTLEAI